MINSKYKIINVFIAVFLLNTIACSQNNQIKPYALSKGYTPVLNSPEFSSVFGGKTGTDVKLDKEGLIAEMEFIAFQIPYLILMEQKSEMKFYIMRLLQMIISITQPNST